VGERPGQRREAGAEIRRRLSRRRLMGLDRSGPEPVQTRAGQPLRPFTIPNLIGYVRLAAIPVFLIIAFDSGDGRDGLASVIFLAIALGDLLDGFVARATGQYSRMGALLDPVVDRLTILSGAVVCWHFELLPRWALALVVARELVMLVAVLFALRAGLDLHINWLGRIAVWPTMGAVGAALFGWDGFDAVLLYVGLAGSIAASVQYGVDGVRELRAR
jgi:cardiolipin synthase